MACEEWRSKLAAYADGELPAEEMRSLDAHLRGCISCSTGLLQQTRWKRATHFAGKRYKPSPEFRRRIEQQVAARQRAARTAWLPRFAVALAAVALIVFGSFQWLAVERTGIFGELVDLHVASLASSAPVDVISSDRHTVKPWFEGRIPFTFNLPELQQTPFTLMGGRVAYLGQQPAAELLFQIRSHKLSVFIAQEQPLWRAAMRPGEVVSKQLSFTLETWSEAGLRYFIVSDTAEEDVRQLAHLLKTSARS